MAIAQVRARIISNKRLAGNYWHLEFESKIIARRASAGQFVNIKVNPGSEPLLRRPISIHGVKASRVKLIYEVLGLGTQALSRKNPQEFLDVVGPLGNGFNYRQSVKSKNAKNILIAGGMGVAPLVFLAERLKLSKPLILIGARTKNQILCAPEFKSLGCTLKLATDDGSLGFKGKVTDLLENILASTIDYRLYMPAVRIRC